MKPLLFIVRASFCLISIGAWGFNSSRSAPTAELAAPANVSNSNIIVNHRQGGFVPNTSAAPVAGVGPSSGNANISPLDPPFRLVRCMSAAHPAVDLQPIDGQCGHSVHSVHNGTVVAAGWVRGYGNTVVIDNEDGTFALYGHMPNGVIQSFGIHDGLRVRQGQQIGLVGNTGIVQAGRGGKGCHLHFEIRHDTQFGNPIEFYPGLTSLASQVPANCPSGARDQSVPSREKFFDTTEGGIE